MQAEGAAAPRPDRCRSAAMKTMKSIILFLLALCPCLCVIADTNDIAVGNWSEPVGDSRGYKLRGRLLICETPRHRGPGGGYDTAVYLELQECSDYIGETLQVYCNMEGGEFLGPDFKRFEKAGGHWELRDAADNPVAQSPFAFSGAAPGKYWMALPCDSTVRLRVTLFGGGRMDDGSLGFAFPSQYWVIPARSTNDYFLSGTFSVSPPTNRIDVLKVHVWQGTLKLPKMKILVGKE